MLSKLRMWFMSYYSLVFFFVIALALGVILAKVMSWFIIILIVIGVIAYIYSKVSGSSKGDGDDDSSDSDGSDHHSDDNA